MVEQAKPVVKRCTQCGSEVDNLGRAMPPLQPDKFRNPCMAADAIVFREINGELYLLLITRKFDPFKGCIAFPGGFVDYGEDPQTGVLRELKEETLLDATEAELLTVRGDPSRDPRKHVVSICYLINNVQGEPKAGDDAATAQFKKVSEFQENPQLWSFDHYEIFKLALQRYNQKKALP